MPARSPRAGRSLRSTSVSAFARQPALAGVFHRRCSAALSVELGLTPGQALFESVSAITTTGSTAISGLDNAPQGILLWRSLLCWLGGIGIVALGLFILPLLRVGGMTFFRMGSSDTGNDRPFARLASFTRAFVAIYIVMTLACTIAYDFAGMSHFDALNHAMSTVATGGFSTHDASFAYFNNTALLWIATIFLIFGSLPFSVMILLAVRLGWRRCATRRSRSSSATSARSRLPLVSTTISGTACRWMMRSAIPSSI